MVLFRGSSYPEKYLRFMGYGEQRMLRVLLAGRPSESRSDTTWEGKSGALGRIYPNRKPVHEESQHKANVSMLQNRC